MMKSFAAVCAISVMLISMSVGITGCKTDEGKTLTVSAAGQPNGLQTTVGASNTFTPSVFYRGKATNLLMTINVLSAPAGGAANITPRSAIFTPGTAPPPTTVIFNQAGTYVIQVVVQEEGGGDLSASDQFSTVVVPAAGG